MPTARKTDTIDLSEELDLLFRGELSDLRLNEATIRHAAAKVFEWMSKPTDDLTKGRERCARVVTNRIGRHRGWGVMWIEEVEAIIHRAGEQQDFLSPEQMHAFEIRGMRTKVIIAARRARAARRAGAARLVNRGPSRYPPAFNNHEVKFGAREGGEVRRRRRPRGADPRADPEALERSG